MIAVPGQPLAERVLRAALARDAPPQQLLLFGPAGTGKRAAATEVAWALMDPAGAHPRQKCPTPGPALPGRIQSVARSARSPGWRGRRPQVSHRPKSTGSGGGSHAAR